MSEWLNSLVRIAHSVKKIKSRVLDVLFTRLRKRPRMIGFSLRPGNQRPVRCFEVGSQFALIRDPCVSKTVDLPASTVDSLAVESRKAN